MTFTVQKKLKWLKDARYRNDRDQSKIDITEAVAGFDPYRRRAERMIAAVKRETPVFYGDDRFGFNRSCAVLPVENSTRYFFGNVVPDYPTWLGIGLNGIRDAVRSKIDRADKTALLFYRNALDCLSAAYDIIEKYRIAAENAGNKALAEALSVVPCGGAQNYYQALVSVKALHFLLRLNASSHITFGRFDQYMYPYYQKSIQEGMTQADALELTELFFISMNTDTDIIAGIQPGDNGQSMMLGGYDKDGRDQFNELSEICMTASEELGLIDPKINLRVNSHTPLSFYERGTKLTKMGLGFPQYTNDDIVIPFLLKMGYDADEVYDYAVAACWEIILPYDSGDIVNRSTVNFPLAVEKATKEYLLTDKTFEEFLCHTLQCLDDHCEEIMAKYNSVCFSPDPFLSLLIRPCIANGRDVSDNGAKYNNSGLHGAGIAVAADALQAIRTVIYNEKSVTPEELLCALRSDFDGQQALRAKLLSCHKMGNNFDDVDAIAGILMKRFSETVNGKPNNRGGVYRAGTGSAMDYIVKAKLVGATADGRKAFTPFPSSFSPSLIAKMNGPLSAVQSFTKNDLTDICNGGPFTIEIHDTVFSHPDGETKTAALIKSFIDRGGHQIQINAINQEVLTDAVAHPEDHKGLIVRVWGWSGYFTELDPVYQNQIISRMEFEF